MKKIYVAALTGYAGKTLTTMGLATHFIDKGKKVSFFKPVGALPFSVEGKLTDEDAWRVARFIKQDCEPDEVCPVVVTQDVIVSALKGQFQPPWEKILALWEKLTAGSDIAIVGGYGALSSGTTMGLSGLEVCKRLDCKMILVARYGGPYIVDDILVKLHKIRSYLLGVILNDVSPEDIDTVASLISPYLEKQSVPVLGIIAHNETVAAVSVSDLQEFLGARVLAGYQGMNQLVEHFLIGGMQVDKAISWFLKVPNNAVITGGDRGDIQLAAIESGTKCLILTGGMTPNDVILSKAEEKGVPILEVPDDTYATAKRIETMSRKLRLRHPTKLHKAIDLFRSSVDLERLESLL